ncbi:unnamed protein product, partial [Didymodactylos carnosus]
YAYFFKVYPENSPKEEYLFDTFANIKKFTSFVLQDNKNLLTVLTNIATHAYDKISDECHPIFDPLDVINCMASSVDDYQILTLINTIKTIDVILYDKFNATNDIVINNRKECVQNEYGFTIQGENNTGTTIFDSLVLLHELAHAVVPPKSSTPIRTAFACYHIQNCYDVGCFLEHICCSGEVHLHKNDPKMYILTPFGPKKFVSDVLLQCIYDSKSFHLLNEYSNKCAGQQIHLAKLDIPVIIADDEMIEPTGDYRHDIIVVENIENQTIEPLGEYGRVR